MNKDDIVDIVQCPDNAIKGFVKQLGIDICYSYNPQILIPEERIRAFCARDKCGNYNTRYMCPPNIGSIEENTIKLKKFNYGLLLQYSKSMEIHGNREGIKLTMLDFHTKILQVEEFLINRGASDVWALIGGTCLLCDTCGAKSKEPCLHPDKARSSLEAIGIDVLKLLEEFNLDNKFHKDKITWTGSVLFNNTAVK